MDAILKFQGLLEKLFQFDASDLDFGIYRILSFKGGRGVFQSQRLLP
jgi:adenine-specific DNA-methyltransferase